MMTVTITLSNPTIFIFYTHLRIQTGCTGVNLLLLESNNRKHYILVKNMSRLIANRTKHNGNSFVGNSRLRASSYSADLENHKTYRRTNARQQVYYPNPAKGRRSYHQISRRKENAQIAVLLWFAISKVTQSSKMISMQQQQMQREIETITFLQVSLVIELRTWNNIELNLWLILERM
jgi:hypothetical protein